MLRREAEELQRAVKAADELQQSASDPIVVAVLRSRFRTLEQCILFYFN
jgi:hypothetical protein